MTISNSRLSYSDCYDILDKALASTKGIRITIDTYDIAFHLRMRLHQARKIDRKDNAKLYDPGMPMHNASDYDGLVVRIRQGEACAYVFVEKVSVGLVIEDLADLGEEVYDDCINPSTDLKQVIESMADLPDPLPPSFRRRL